MKVADAMGAADVRQIIAAIDWVVQHKTTGGLNMDSATWSGRMWSSGTWTGRMWSGDGWSGNTWSSAGWN